MTALSELPVDHPSNVAHAVSVNGTKLPQANQSSLTTSSTPADPSPVSPATADAHIGRADGTQLADRHSISDAHSRRAVGEDSTSSPKARVPHATHAAGGQDSRDDRRSRAAQSPTVVTGATPPATIALAVPDVPASLGAPTPHAEHLTTTSTETLRAGTTPPTTKPPLVPMPAPSLADPLLALAADVLDDTERTRLSNENRLRQLTRTEPDEDGETRGFGLDETHPDVARLAAMVAMLGQVEHDATLNLNRIMRKHPLGPWCKAQRGIGEKQAARLLAAIGDPYVNMSTGQPRTVSQLWAYSGLHVLPASQGDIDTRGFHAGGALTSDPSHSAQGTQKTLAGVAARRQKGVKSNWSGNAKMRAYLIATSCIKQAESPYRAVYDARRTHTAVTHPDWTPGHSHNDGLRIVSKAVLRDLWREAKRIHETGVAA